MTRCAYARGLPQGVRSPTAGFRCCAGPRNDAEVHLEEKWGVAFEKTVHPARSSPPLDALEGAACGPPLWYIFGQDSCPRRTAVARARP